MHGGILIGQLDCDRGALELLPESVGSSHGGVGGGGVPLLLLSILSFLSWCLLQSLSVLIETQSCFSGPHAD